MPRPLSRGLGSTLALLLISSCGWAVTMDFSRLIVYDVRGHNQAETAIILEQRGAKVTVWLKNYLGDRRGEVPFEEYHACFNDMQTIRQFALKEKYRGRGLRASAARGTVTLAWEISGERQIKTIRYYAPENTLDDFRHAFNRIWALSRYAVLSLSSFESTKQEYVEDAVYFLSGAGWMTVNELETVVAFHTEKGHATRVVACLWNALERSYSPSSPFADRDYLLYCVRQCMLRMGEPAVVFLKTHWSKLSPRKREFAQTILDRIPKAENIQ